MISLGYVLVCFAVQPLLASEVCPVEAAAEPEVADSAVSPSLLQATRQVRVAAISGPCKRWCIQKEKPWEEKCAKKSNCRGCLECSLDPLPPSGGCKSACETDPLNWQKKCSWPECGGCSNCAGDGGDGEGATTTVRPENDTSWVGRRCSRWCLNKEDSWEYKCANTRECRGCPECHQDAWPSSPGCAFACADDPLRWSKKCESLYECSRCPQCQEDYNPGADIPSPTFPVPPFSLVPPLPGSVNRTLEVTAGQSSATEVRLPSGSPYAMRVRLAGAGGSAAPSFRLEGGHPAGLGVHPRTGVVTWQPGAHQAGNHTVAVVAESEAAPARLTLALAVEEGSNLPVGIYVWMAGGSDDADGTASAPLATIARAAAIARPGDTVYVRGGSYSAKEVVRAVAPRDNPVLITRLPGERVRLVAQRKRHIFEVPDGSEGITFRGLELDGDAAGNDHWTVLRRSWWRVNDEVLGGWNGFLINGQHIVVEHCSIHDFNNKGVDIVKARYVTLRYNLIYNIGFTSLSGGGGIHRKWDATFRTPDDPRYFRWDVFGNAVWSVEQRLYSYIPKQKWALLALDEGKPMAFDSTRDKEMKARVAHNLVLYGGVVHIRLFPNPNLQVHNNAVYGDKGRIDPVPNGITCKGEGSSNEGKISGVFGGRIENLTLFSNLVETGPGSLVFGMHEQFEEGDNPARVNHNYYSGGGRTQPEYQPGLIRLPTAKAASVFRDPGTQDFRPSEPLPQGVGVDQAILEHLSALAADFGAVMSPSGFRHDHCENLRVILESTPREHLGSPTLREQSRYKRGHKAYAFKVNSEFYRQTCKCSEVELILPDHMVEACLH